MTKIINAILLAIILFIFLFIILNFLYSNMTTEALGYPIVFRFKIPGYMTLRSVEMPIGFVLIASFSAGILFLAFLQALPVIFRGRDSRRQQKRIKMLEKEISLISQVAEAKSKKAEVGSGELEDKDQELKSESNA